MQVNLILYALYQVLIMSCVILGALRWVWQQRALKSFYTFIIVAFIGEALALFAEYQTGTNVNVYNAMDIITAVTVYLYFGIFLQRLNLGLTLCVLTAAFGIFNYYWLQYENLVNNYFLLWSTLVTIALCLYGMIVLYKRADRTPLFAHVHFWINLVLLIYSVTTLLNLQLFNALMQYNSELVVTLNMFHLAVNLICYSAILLIFYFLPNLIQ